MECFPGDDFSLDTVNGWLEELWNVGLIDRYNHEGEEYLSVSGWQKHQRIDKPSYKYPPLDKDGNPAKFDERSRNGRLPFDDRSTADRNGMDRKGEERSHQLGRRTVVDHSSTEPAEVPLLVFQTSGVGPRSWDLSQRRIDQWSKAYPGLDILGECRKALAWLEANGFRTARGMPRFLVGWFNRAVDSGRTGRGRKPSESVDLDAIEARVKAKEAQRRQQGG